MNVHSTSRFTLLKTIFLPLVVIALLLSACGAETKASQLPDPEEVKALLVQLVDEEKVAPGFVVGMIAADPPERWVVGYGKLSADDERVPDGDTVYEIGSITKGFTGILLAQAVVNGEVKLDDPISMYLPEGVTAPEYEGKSITLLDLATHTSGLPTFSSENLCEEYTMDQLYSTLSGYQMTRAPGSVHEYSNFAFGLLGDLLARRAGKANYEELLVERITRPLGMDSTRIGVTPEMRSRLAAPHEGYFTPSCSFVDSALFATGGIRSTANDMLTFLAAEMGLTDTDLSPAMQLANTPQRPINGIDYMGLGWEVGTTIFRHGKTWGYYSVLTWDPQRKVGVVVLTNTRDYAVSSFGVQLLLGNVSVGGTPRTIEITLTAWAILTAGCLAFLIWGLWSRRPAPLGARLMWLLTTALMGPVGLVIYWISTGAPQHAGSPLEPTAPARRALGSAAWAATGNAMGGIGVLALIVYLPYRFGANPILQIVAAILLTLCVGWLIFAASRWLSRSAAEHDLYSKRPFFAELVSTCLVLAGLFSTVNIIIWRWIVPWNAPNMWDLLSLPVWGTLCLGAIAGTLVTYLFHLWMLRRGEFRWGSEATAEEVSAKGMAWYGKIALVVLSFVIMLGALFLAMQIA